jgi:UPF0755 protein
MRRLLFIIGIILILTALVGGWFANVAWLSQPQAGAPVNITVTAGMTGRGVREILGSDGLVWPPAYAIYAWFDPSVNHPQPGTYAFRMGTSYRDIARTIATGPAREEVDVRLIEGKTLDDEREVLAKLGADSAAFTQLAGASMNTSAFDQRLVKQYPFLSGIPGGLSLEGYLFPDTYRVWKDHLVDALVLKQLDELDAKVIQPYSVQQKASGMTWHQILTLASIVEAEVRSPADRKIVAGIFLNRLNKGMRLQSDATLNYEIGEGRDRATYEDLALNSPYNTYKSDGLPPGPINNPSLSSIQAVLDPAKTNYYFFLSDKSGRMYYARTGAEHQANRAAAFGE